MRREDPLRKTIFTLASLFVGNFLPVSEMFLRYRSCRGQSSR